MLYPKRELMCFSPGIVGILDEKQEKEFCTVKKVEEDCTDLKKDVEEITEDIKEGDFDENDDEEDEDLGKLFKMLDRRYKKVGM